MKKVIFSVAFALIINSCSTSIDRPPPKHMWSHLEHADCETDSALPVLDNVTGGLLLGWGIVGLAFANPLSILDIVAGGTLIAVGTNGNTKLKNCEKLETHIANRKEREEDRRYHNSEIDEDEDYYQTTDRVIKTKEDDEEEKLKKQLRILELKKKIKKMNNED